MFTAGPEAASYRRPTVGRPEEPSTAKPVLLRLMHHLISQWEEEMSLFAPSVFEPWIYYRDMQSKAIPSRVQGDLYKNHELFSHKEVNRIILISILSTMRARHRPTAQYQWRVKFGG